MEEKLELFSIENLGLSSIETAENSKILIYMNYHVFQKYLKKCPE